MKKIIISLICVLLTILIVPAYAELIDNGDGTITDTNTNLTWLKNANLAGQTMTWEEAKAWAENLVFAGHDDWRLPCGYNPDGRVCNSRPQGANCTETEFWSLWEGYLINVFNPGPFENIGYRNYWTSAEWPENYDNAMAQDLEDWGQNDYPKTNTFYAWAVRGYLPPILRVKKVEWSYEVDLDGDGYVQSATLYVFNESVGGEFEGEYWDCYWKYSESSTWTDGGCGGVVFPVGGSIINSSDVGVTEGQKLIDFKVRIGVNFMTSQTPYWDYDPSDFEELNDYKMEPASEDVPPTINVTSPNGGEAWQVNSTQNITWNSEGAVSGFVKIDLSTDGGSNWTTIFNNISDDGSEPWTVPDTPSTNCLIRITDSDGTPSDVSDGPFAISPGTATQNISVKHGRINMISFNILPSDLAVDVLLDDLETLLVAQDDNGKFYIPPYSVNTIGYVDLSNGYQVYITGSADDNVVNNGSPLVPQDYSQALNNTKLFMIGYPYQNPHPVVDVFASITSSVVVVQDDEGRFWIPMYGVNTMGNMQPGKGYQIYVNQTVTFTYPALSGGLVRIIKPVAELPEPSHFQFQRTGIPYGIVVTGSEEVLAVGDEVGVFAGELCVGSSVFTGDYPIVTAAWEGHEEYGLTGFKVGEPISFRVWKTSEGLELKVAGRFDTSDEYSFRGGPISVVSLEASVPSVVIPSAFGLNQNYPNPFNTETVIKYQLPRSGKVVLRIYNSLGQLIRILVNEEKEAGYHEVHWDGMDAGGKNVTSGIYIYHIQAGDFVGVRKMLFLM